jgi:tetratricopeptide (TPR) repeat protein
MAISLFASGKFFRFIFALVLISVTTAASNGYYARGVEGRQITKKPRRPIPSRTVSGASGMRHLLASDPAGWDGRFVGQHPNGSNVPWAYPANTPISQIVPVRSTTNNSGGEVIWYINGIWTDIGGQHATMQIIAQQTGNPVIGIRNATAGEADVTQTVNDIRRQGINEATNTLADLLIQELTAGRSPHLLAHSQGTVIVRNAIEAVKKKLEASGKSFCDVLKKLSLIRAEIYGSPIFDFPTGPSYHHSCNYNDTVCDGILLRQPPSGQTREVRDRDAGVSKNTQGGLNCGLITIPNLNALLSSNFSDSQQAILKSKMYGGNANVDNFDCRVPTLIPFDDHSINDVYLKRRANVGVTFLLPPECSANIFLFDTSGSMADGGKWDGALSAGLDALKALEQDTKEMTAFYSTAVISFAGDCSPAGAKKLFDFTTDIALISNKLPSALPRPSGSTPLYTSLDVAFKELDRYVATTPNLTTDTFGGIYLYSDGQDTCEGNIRPDSVYGSGGKNFAKSNLLGRMPKNTRIFAVGYDLAPGSKGERDLQYLSFVSGGKYYNAADPRQLKRGFQKLTQSYYPKQVFVNKTQSSKYAERLYKAGVALQKKKSAEALTLYRQLDADFKREGITSSGLLFNLAQSLEANDRYRGAVDYYQLYLKSSPGAPDQAAIEQKIITLKQDYKDQFEYYLKIVESDLDYLKKYYGDLFNKQNNALAAEFAGFVTEKGEFYTNLQDILEVQNKDLKDHSKDLSDGLYDLSDRVGSDVFDRDAVSLLTIPISELEEILTLLNANKSRFMSI